MSESSPSIALMSFSDEEARTVQAVAERIIPGDPDNAGATDAGVVYYIDRAVAGFSTDLQPVYRRGIRALNDRCRGEFGAVFAELDSTRQDEVVTRYLGPPVADEAAARPTTDAVLDRFFAVVREHTIEGFFCDPVYGGNRDAAGWKLVGFPGAHWGYTAEQMAPGFDGRTVPIKTLSQLRAELDQLPPNEIFTEEA